MTISAVIIDILVFLGIISVALWVGSDFESVGGGITALFIGVLILVFIIFGELWYFSSTESGKRSLKSQESNLKDGIPRHIEIFDVNGELIKEYEGKFDIAYDDDRILFDHEKGKRHIIYYPTGTIIIDEIE